jgi:hypothetical protein
VNIGGWHKGKHAVGIVYSFGYSPIVKSFEPVLSTLVCDVKFNRSYDRLIALIHGVDNTGGFGENYSQTLAQN